MKRSPFRAAAACLLALSLAIPATAVAASETTTERARAVERIRAVDRGANRFRPARLTISRGTRVRFVNAGSLTHTTTSDTGLWDESLSPGERFTRRFRRAGTFRFSCTIHPEMQGTIRVT